MKAISVESVSKQYRYGRTGYVTLRQEVQSWLARVRGVDDPNAKMQGRSDAAHTADGPDRFWALQEVSFTVDRGEVVGIIGRNGAGKSTLLKIMSRVTAPTRGFVKLNGRVASLLEVGTGFHPELTGRENVYLNGTVLGMTRAEVRAKFDEIVAFAELDRFIDTPVKRYSSGMVVRLAFAVAAHLEPEILLVDEVLAVGDWKFQSKCLGKIGEVSRAGRTVLLVSHNLGAVAKLCRRGIVLHRGSVIADGEVSEALRVYLSPDSGAESPVQHRFRGTMQHKLAFRELRINGMSVASPVQVRPEEALTISIRGEAFDDIPAFRTTVHISRDGRLLMGLHDSEEPCLLPRGAFLAEITVPPLFLGPGDYTLTFGGYSVESPEFLWSEDPAVFAVLHGWAPGYDAGQHMGLVNVLGVGRRVTHRALGPGGSEG